MRNSAHGTARGHSDRDGDRPYGECDHPDDEGDFAGIRVVDASQGIAGPYCAMLFAQHGADVVKIEPLEGDWTRGLGVRRGDHTVTEACANRGKRSLALDLRKDQAIDVVRRLVETADVFIESGRPGAAKRLGIDFESLKRYQARIIHASFSGYGQIGPYASLPMTDTVAQAFSGIMALNRDSNGTPQKLGHYFVDLIGSLYGFQAISAALYKRAIKGGGARRLDISLMQASAAIQSAKLAESALEGNAPPVINAPAGCYQTADGWLAITLMREEQFVRLCKALDLADIPLDPRFNSFPSRAANLADLLQLLRPAFGRLSTEHWVERLRAADVMVAPILDYRQWLEDRHVQDVGAIAEIDQPGLGTLPVPAIPGVRPLGPHDARAVSPGIGQHSVQILEELRYDNDAIASLQQAGIIRTPRL